MASPSCFLRLPIPLLLLLSSLLPAAVAESEKSYNPPSHVKYFLEEESLWRRNAVIQQRLASEMPNAVRKMSIDQGEMFFPEYWGFQSLEEIEQHSQPALNTSMEEPFQAPFLVHSDGRSSLYLFGRYAEAPSDKRDFACPVGTFSCTSISRPNSCCANGLQCNLIANTGLGDVGCCAGSSCSGVATCQSGYTACPNDGGGCCIPGYQCAGVGCVLSSTQTVVVVPTVTVTPAPSTASPSTTPTPTSVAAITTNPAPTTSTSVAYTCTSGFQSCAASLGGGCCPTDHICGTSTCETIPATSTTTVDVGAIRPTSAPATTITAAGTTSTVTICPTGFYQCSAYYNAGACCQVGRDCALTSCPPRVSTTVLASDGVVVIVGATATAATAALQAGQVQGSCATGWLACPNDVGGGCCPSGFACGTASCSATAGASASATGEVAKQATAGKVAVGAWWMTMGVWVVGVVIWM